jgi:hypothetical protein
MSKSVTKCAIKRTVKKAGVVTLGIILGASLLILFMSGIAALFEMIAFTFPIINTVFPFVLLTGLISLPLFFIIYSICEEYKENRITCEDRSGTWKK